MSRQALPRVAQAGLDAQQRWLAWLRDMVPAELGERISGAVEHRGSLVIYASSAAWCTRLKYALADALPRCQEHAPQIRALQVRVRPPGKAPRKPVP